MRIVAFSESGAPRLGLLSRDRITEVRAPGAATPAQLARLDAADLRGGRIRALGEVALSAPARPRVVISVDDNFRDQSGLRRGGLAAQRVPAVERHLRPGPADHAWYLARDPASVVGPRRVVLPIGCERLDCGVSLALVVGRPAVRVPPERAWEFIAGVTIAVDVVRDEQLPGRGSLARSYATHTPLGPALVTADELPSDLPMTMTLTVNGEPRQRTTTAEMIASPAALLAAITRRVPLAADDVILTGTPGGGARDAGWGWLQCGDEIEARIDGLGELCLTVNPETA